ncbi:MAG: tRNA pseudouridine(55) synthase TruB [Rhodospirillales bacterium]|nr:tRNA pseudouridine(55) synthase TruB [Rhodospirillales bacterium]MBO6787542.1 tRNA pseudouridine(55) synthase TruB [Rhodospirillales bacterium]
MARKRKGTPIHGWLILDKPEGPSSNGCVGRIRWLTGAAKVGHGGTLDPLASGVLPIAFGEATKTQSYAMDGYKTYEFRARWGESTDTDDAEGEITARSGKRPSREEIEAALPLFTGKISQIPPVYSAIKVDGERAYKRARRDEDVEIAPRDVDIAELRLIGIPDADHADFEMRCGKGTYVRALVRDLALHLGCEGHIRRLRRTAVGPFSIEKAVKLDAFEADEGEHAAALLEQYLLPVETVLDDIPALALTEQEARRLKQGQGVPVLPVAQRSPLRNVTQGDVVQVTANGTLLALARISGGEIRPFRVMNI